MSEQWNLKCPACKTDRWVHAEAVIPRLEQGMCVCVDCGCLFAALPKWPGQREYLITQVADRKAREAKQDV